MISHQYKFIFVHAGRTGGSSFERIAEISVTADPRTQHMGNTDFPEKHREFQYYRDTYRREFDTYFKFTIVRNPFDRLVSAWFWRTQVVRDIRPCTLKEFVLARPPSSTYAAKFRLPGYSLRESVTRFDYIGRFEDLPGPYEYVCNKTGHAVEANTVYQPDAVRQIFGLLRPGNAGVGSESVPRRHRGVRLQVWTMRGRRECEKKNRPMNSATG